MNEEILKKLIQAGSLIVASDKMSGVQTSLSVRT